MGLAGSEKVRSSNSASYHHTLLLPFPTPPPTPSQHCLTWPEAWASSWPTFYPAPTSAKGPPVTGQGAQSTVSVSPSHHFSSGQGHLLRSPQPGLHNGQSASKSLAPPASSIRSGIVSFSLLGTISGFTLSLNSSPSYICSWLTSS
jgi:hypothetical protein